MLLLLLLPEADPTEEPLDAYVSLLLELELCGEGNAAPPGGECFLLADCPKEHEEEDREEQVLIAGHGCEFGRPEEG
jgi:hypothetical protein